MANKDYNKISTKSKNKDNTPDDVTVIDHEPTPIVEKKKSNVNEELSNKDVNINEPKKGFVSNCEKLNIRNTPDIDSEILIVVNKGTKVEINEELSNDKFYSVTAYCPNDITVIGYAMKDFITIK